jgi:hypothetical protein
MTTRSPIALLLFATFFALACSSDDSTSAAGTDGTQLDWGDAADSGVSDEVANDDSLAPDSASDSLSDSAPQTDTTEADETAPPEGTADIPSDGDGKALETDGLTPEADTQAEAPPEVQPEVQEDILPEALPEPVAEVVAEVIAETIPETSAETVNPTDLAPYSQCDDDATCQAIFGAGSMCNKAFPGGQCQGCDSEAGGDALCTILGEDGTTLSCKDTWPPVCLYDCPCPMWLRCVNDMCILKPCSSDEDCGPLVCRPLSEGGTTYCMEP